MLEDAIAEVESSYLDEIDDDPIAELANIFDYSRRLPILETAALNLRPTRRLLFRLPCGRLRLSLP